jgi:hypothetical protein
MVQGVRQLCPSEVFASAPPGLDSISSSVVVGLGLKALKLGMETELQDARLRLAIATATKRLPQRAR